MKLKLLAISSVIALTGCATKDYALYAETQQKIAQAQAMSDAARYAALAEIAKQGDSAAKVAAVMSLQMGGGSGSGPRVNQVAPPKSMGETALQWTSVLLPSLTQFYGIAANRQVAITQSNNQAAIAQSTNSTFATMSNNQATSNTAIANAGLTAATNIANSGLTAVTTTAANGLTATTNVANSGLTAVTTVANTGIAQVGTTAAAGLTAATAINASSNTAITNVSNAANTSITNLANQIPNLQPNVTTTTTTTTTNNNNLTCPVGKTMVAGSCV